MEREIINRIEVLDSGELLLGLESQGKPMFQYVYREGTGVYWDTDRHGFKSTPMNEWSCAQWFRHIVAVVRSGVGVELILGENVVWLNVPEEQKQEIKEGQP